MIKIEGTQCILNQRTIISTAAKFIHIQLTCLTLRIANMYFCWLVSKAIWGIMGNLGNMGNVGKSETITCSPLTWVTTALGFQDLTLGVLFTASRHSPFVSHSDIIYSFKLLQTHHLLHTPTLASASNSILTLSIRSHNTRHWLTASTSQDQFTAHKHELTKLRIC